MEREQIGFVGGSSVVGECGKNQKGSLICRWRVSASGGAAALLWRRKAPSAARVVGMTSSAADEASAPPAATDLHSTSALEKPVVPADGRVRARRALVSVSDKSQLIGLCGALAELNIEILSTGGSARALKEAGLEVVEVSDYTGFPELLDGRLKTLNPKIHGGLLGVRDNESHVEQMSENGIEPIDLVIVNLYPFESTVASGADFPTCVENIDVGGPTMLRAAAKNYRYVTVVSDVGQYAELVTELTDSGGYTTSGLRARFAAAVYARTAAYDAAIATWFAAQIASGKDGSRSEGEENETDGETVPAVFSETLNISATLKQTCRYGENPHQQAAFYSTGKNALGLGAVSDQQVQPCVATAEVVQGKELSYNNIGDTDAAFELVSEFSEPAVAIIKHANPCGVAIGVNPRDAYLRALACDPVSAFGGIVAFNRTIDKDAAEDVIDVFTEVVIAPDVTAEALAVFSAKKNLRVLLTGGMPSPSRTGMTLKSVSGGFLLQSRDAGMVGVDDLKVVTKRAPTDEEMTDLLFAWKVCKHVKSNAIVFAKGGASIGAGAGQMSRVDSARIATWKAREAAEAAQEEASRAVGSVCASDAFFPFADGVEAIAEAGCTAVIQPGGSRRDAEVIAACDERDIAMVFTGMRHFRH